ncbi:hypothetical protein NDU88_002361 [Pleurodeles waltl]|uniref:Reverse transcriptase zinc-binding domain-containing protein n=1 Tax=Pleurodeles waltl TaxID=8319 RepID=A0AAV7KTB6_PLEWA|nr:hypothetical protein NDU88_002361 [Pleurodeles waltl]
MSMHRFGTLLAQDALAIPLKEAGFLQWKHLCYNGELRDFNNLNIEVGGGLSKFKCLQMKSWVGNVTEEVGSTNGLVDQMQLDIPMKKEVARWDWLMMDIVDGESNLPEEIWRECLPKPQLKDLWQVSTALLYNTVKLAALRRNHLFSIHRAFWTPKKLSRLRQDNVVRCKKCGFASAADLHMFIDCPLLHSLAYALDKVLAGLFEDFIIWGWAILILDYALFLIIMYVE